MITQVLRGKIEPLALIDVLAYLGRNKATGALRVSQGDIEKSLIISDGTIIFARSNQAIDRLGDMLLAKKLITQEAYSKAAALIYEKGIRHGRALVEGGAISPKQLWHNIQSQVRSIACSVIPWETGQFEFFKQPIKKKESITLKWPILDMIQDVIRNLDNVALFKHRFPEMSEVLAINERVSDQIKLESYEEYILNFIDGKMSLQAICTQSDYGEPESLRVLYLLKSLGWVTVVSKVVQDAPIEPKPSEEVPVEPEFAAEPKIPTEPKPSDELTADLEDIVIHPMVSGFNKIYAYIYGYLSERVDAVGTKLLNKFFVDTVKDHPQILAGVLLSNEGLLDEVQLQKNFDRLSREGSSSETELDNALNEYLNLCILAVTKLLGSEDEHTVCQKISEFV